MSNRKFRDLPLYTGSTTGTYLILNNSSQTTTYKVTKETLFSGFTGNAGTSGTSGSSGTRGSSGSSGTAGTSGTSGLAGDLYRTTSSTSLTIQTGTTGTFVIGTGLGYSVAQDVIIAYDISNHMVGMVTSYNPSNGQMVVNVHDKIGSGTYTGWTVNLNGAAGGDGSSGTSGSSGSSGDSIFHLSGSTYYTTSSILINNNLEISGTTTLGGNILPKTPRGATLGSLTNPFADIFVSSGSINIAGIPGQPNTTLSNVSGNILISAGGMQLLGQGSFNAATASFSYLSGSFQHIGSQFNIGDTVTTGSLQVSGSSIQIGNNTLKGNTILSGSIIISGSQDSIGTNHMIGDQQLTGSLTVSGSTVQIGNNTLEGNTKLSGSVTITGSLYLTGSGGVGFINSHRILTDVDSGSFLTISGNTNNNVLTATGLSNNIQGESNLQFDGSNLNLTGSEIVNGNVIVTGSIIMDGTLQTNIPAVTVTNPSNYVLHQFLTSSYHGGTYAFSVHEDSTGKVTIYSNYIVAQGANSINSNIGGDSKVTAGAGAPNPSFAVGFSGSYAQFKVTDTGTFTYRGIVQLY